MSYRIQIASVPDREQVVSEIWFNNQMIAEINQEGPALAIELYPTPGPLELNDLLNTIQTAARGLRPAAYFTTELPSQSVIDKDGNKSMNTE